jgi:hypothetical protein
MITTEEKRARHCDAQRTYQKQNPQKANRWSREYYQRNKALVCKKRREAYAKKKLEQTPPET